MGKILQELKLKKNHPFSAPENPIKILITWFGCTFLTLRF